MYFRYFLLQAEEDPGEEEAAEREDRVGDRRPPGPAWSHRRALKHANGRDGRGPAL